jgi:hypothetical protein
MVGAMFLEITLGTLGGGKKIKETYLKTHEQNDKY